MRSETAPTGRRKTTPAMLAARALRPANYEPARRGDVLGAFKRAAEAIGCPDRLLRLVDLLVGFTQAQDWQHGGRVWAWPSNAVLCDGLAIGVSQLKSVVRVGQELGLFELHDSPTGKRHGFRDTEGRVAHAYGFDLSPLAYRLPEFRQLAADRRARWKDGERLRAHITSTRNKVLSLCDLGLEQGAAGEWTAIGERARQLSALRGQSRDPGLLAPLAAELAELEAAAIEALTPTEAVETDPMGPENRPLLTPTNQESIAKANTIDGPSRPGAFAGNDTAQPRGRHPEHRPAPGVETDKRKGVALGALRGFVATPAFVVKIAPAFETWTGKAAPSWPELLDASTFIRSDLGISAHAWGQACVVLGRMEAVVLLATIAARHDAGQVASPGGMLRRMVDLHQEGKLRLDRTLYGLAGRVGALAA